MAVTISLTIPNNAEAQNILTAFTGTYGYVATLPDGSANPETPAQFTKRMIIEYVRSVEEAYRVNSSVDTARDTAIRQPRPGIT